ncbi:hypothetical protein SNE40_018183 [Patella caerulea]|uniref:HAT C-terminal dimerisation domain-containing protein n=1 Tax=Patella caerulea TaxID=87958 RepID=A0AAN8PB40_PATCE
MASSIKKSRSEETVSLKTFKSWDFHGDFNFEVNEENKIRQLTCKICTYNIAGIRREAKRRGISGTVLNGIINYVDGVTYIHKSNVSRHVASGSLHDWAKRRQHILQNEDKTDKITDTVHDESTVKSSVCILNKTSTLTTVRPTVTSSSTCASSSTISQLFDKTNKVHHKNHFNTALAVVMRERPMSDYMDLIELQKKNGLQFMTAQNNSHSCREFIKYLALAIREDITKLLGYANFFSCEQDGTEARKTRDEKELVYAKVVVRGKPIELLLKCQQMNAFGGVDASAIKRSIDDAFQTYGVAGDRYTNCLVSACADGASVNMGRLTGALTVMKNEDRDWLLIIHCSSHRIELAMKDAFMAIDDFTKIDDMMLNLYYFFKNSGKCWRILVLLAERLNVILQKIPKSSGTRFQGHKYRAIKVLIVDFLPLCLFAENMISSTNKSCKVEQKAKLQGYLNQWLDYGYLASMHLYRLALQQTAHLSYISQNATPLITDIIHGLKSTVDELNDLIQSTEDLPFNSTPTDDGLGVVITPESTDLPATLKFKEMNKLSEKQKDKLEKHVTVVKEKFTLKNVARGKAKANRIKAQLIPAITDTLNTRLESFNEPIFQAYKIADHSQWDPADADYGKAEIICIGTHFRTSLSFHKYSQDMALVEWKGIRKLVSSKFNHFKNSIMLWQQIFRHHHTEFPHILLVIEIILTTGISSSTVERGISMLNRLMSHSRTSMNNKTIDDLLVIRINLPLLSSCDPYYESKMVEKAIKLYSEGKKRRKPKAKASHSSISADNTPDIYLPIPSTSIIKGPELLIDEDFLQGLSDKDMDSDSSYDSEETEVNNDSSNSDDTDD